MPNLKVVYDDKELFNGDVEHFTWEDAPGVVTFTGSRAKPGGLPARRPRPSGLSPLTGLLSALAQPRDSELRVAAAEQRLAKARRAEARRAAAAVGPEVPGDADPEAEVAP